MRTLLSIWVVATVLVWLPASIAVADAAVPPAPAEAGMPKATMILLMGDLLQAGLKPQVEQNPDGTYYVTVATSVLDAPTAAQVNTFATNRGLTARVLSARIE